MKSRAKFLCQFVQDFGTSQIVQMNAVKDNGDSEDGHFAKYTPSGSFNITVTNEALIGAFKPGKKYYLDITEVEQA